MNDKKLIGIAITLLGAWVSWPSMGYYLQYAHEAITGPQAGNTPTEFSFFHLGGVVVGIVWIAIGIKLFKRQDN